MTKTVVLSTGAIVSINDRRVRVDLPQLSSSHHRYRSLSSAILNGGDHAFSSPTTPTFTLTPTSSSNHCRVINCVVPPTYDGKSPRPLHLLEKFAREELRDDPLIAADICDTVGLLTAASMKTCTTASRQAGGLRVDAIVTAGLSNARGAATDADYFVVDRRENENDHDEGDEDGGDGWTPGDAGTINTIVIIDGMPLTPAAKVEAYAIAIEAKCLAFADHGVACEKDPTRVASGTGTDCCVLISPTTTTDDGMGGDGSGVNVVEHAGKHTLLGEMIGQTVYEATSGAIMINIRHVYGNYAIHALRRWTRSLTYTMGGSRPIVPPRPTMTVPFPSSSIIGMGACAVFLIYAMPSSSSTRADGAKLLLAAVAWDKYLGEPPLMIHPVCIVGSAIGMSLRYTPERAFRSPGLGFACGLLLLAIVVVASQSGARAYIQLADAMAQYGSSTSVDIDHAGGGGNVACEGGRHDEDHRYCKNESSIFTKLIMDVSSWMLKVVLLKSTFSLQLLLSITLQMAHYLERDQMDEARSQLSWLCSRDPSMLCASDLAGATLESLSENLSDGFVAPLFWYSVLGGSIPAAIGYRVVNTLDSRIGYRGRYEWYGKASARFDDLINIIPARITALLLAAAAVIVRGGVRSAQDGLRTAWRDSSQCDSPNAGLPMACFAGILGVRLKKEGSYCFGASGSNPRPANLRDGNRVAHVAGGISILLAVLLISVL